MNLLLQSSPVCCAGIVGQIAVKIVGSGLDIGWSGKVKPVLPDFCIDFRWVCPQFVRCVEDLGHALDDFQVEAGFFRVYDR